MNNKRRNLAEDGHDGMKKRNGRQSVFSASQCLGMGEKLV